VLLVLGAAAAGVPATLTAQSDLDAFMAKVLARRDDNWKKLQQYVLEEKEAFDLTGPGRFPLFGMRRDYSWFIRDGIFVRSPVRANGVALSEADRRKAETEWLRRQQRREERDRRRVTISATDITVEPAAPVEPVEPAEPAEPVEPAEPAGHGSPAAPANMEDVLRQGLEPQFVSSAYFLKFRFESGHYALAGRDTIGGVAALKIEYYPRAGLFREDERRRDRNARRQRSDRDRDREEEIQSKMNKSSMVTLWIDPATHQILQYTFDDLDWDFFPGRALVRIGDVEATMRMGQAFPDIWLPAGIEMRFAMMLAVGTVDAAYRVEYLNYKEAAVTYRIK